MKRTHTCGQLSAPDIDTTVSLIGWVDTIRDQGGIDVYKRQVFVVGEGFTAGKTQLRADGRLADIAPTVLALMGLPKPVEMTGESLIVG